MYENMIFEVSAKRKKIEGIITISTITFILLIIILYMFYFRKLEIFQDTFISIIIGHIKKNITAFSLLGSFYIAVFGGLFFIFVPMEAYFIKALSNTNPFYLYLIFILGIVVSYSLDYLIGMKLSKLSRKLISPKKFYKTKSYLNRYGKIAIFGASALPMFPSQQVTFILGVFRYNKTRLFFLTLLGQMIKYFIIIVIFKYII